MPAMLAMLAMAGDAMAGDAMARPPAGAQEPMPGCDALRPAEAIDGDATRELRIEQLTARRPDGDSALDGRRGLVRGAVTRVVADGFYLQDPFPDPARGGATPSGVFAWTGRDAIRVSPGDAVRLEATVSSWRGGRAASADRGARGAEVPRRATIELHGLHDVRVLASGCDIAPVPLAWPPASDADAQRREGMRVAIDTPLTVQDNHLLARYGELLLAAGGRQRAPTDALRPGPEARAMAAAQARARLLLDDGDDHAWPAALPFWRPDGTGRAGDVVEHLEGVLDTGPASLRADGPRAWRVRATVPVRLLRANPRPAAPPAVGGDARVASANVENFFVTPADGRRGCAPAGRASDCRGARTPAEFERQLAKLATMLAGLDADVIALMELQAGDDRAAEAIAQALDRHAGRHAWAAVGGAPGGRDAIRTGLVYRVDRVHPVGAPQADSDPVHGRAPLAQVFEWPGGARVALVASHLKSKRCDALASASSSVPTSTSAAGLPATDAAAQDPDADHGDGAGCWNPHRVAQARALSRFASAFSRAHGDVGVLLVGDFNAYSREDPLEALRADGWIEPREVAAPATAGAPSAPFPYSFVHDGLAGRLDHVFANAALAPRVTGAGEWHVDADEPDLLDWHLAHRAPACERCAPDAFDAATPWRASDHDPLVIGLRLGGPGARAGRRQ